MLVMTMVSMGGAEQLAERIQSKRGLFALIASPPESDCAFFTQFTISRSILRFHGIPPVLAT